MNRRQFVIGAAVIGIGGSYAFTRPQLNVSELTIAQAISKLDELMLMSPKAKGEWNLAQIFNHCAQSVEFSMLGFPEHKPDWFKSTLGQLAFGLFSQRREMTHNLSEPLPGAAELNPKADIEQAYIRLKSAMVEFSHYDGELAEHFAFGKLDKTEYEQAHAMHFYNHLLEIEHILSNRVIL